MSELDAHALAHTFFLPRSGLDAANMIVIASQIKVAANADVPVSHYAFLDDLRSIIALHMQSFLIEVAEKGAVRKSTSREVILRMEDLLQRLDDAGLRLCSRMWSSQTALEMVHIALNADHSNDATDRSCKLPRKVESGAVVAFLIVRSNMPLVIPESTHGHYEICVNQVPDWDALPNELEAPEFSN